ncbi:hypothetical protein GIW81_03845 [Hyphomicrobium sp. xq]|uniref:Uncharacterized protein n=1 Tax=Hyphomicrobium album TaxID=2665159 RepID=A0A6I3KH27_9HYPH|nr:hypothetical protein [Hyphomicrobium album]MTD93466.1 hypothetical protein [Hyphomicrobium album]
MQFYAAGAVGFAVFGKDRLAMPSWFTPPVVSLAVTILAIAIYHTYVNSAPRPQSVAVNVTSDMSALDRLPPGWHT